ncbi:MAG TPA: patatin-like phospholipase family protein [Bacteroidia bacterium]|jgi:patatin-like phospholipase/acyl hydrolase|nr:patatin-like phospholipase family protein [Bacteroidia bacterium]
MLKKTKPFRILSIDGGGIRGIIPGQILVSIEEKLKTKTKNPNARIADFFDLIVGTSTGGILTIAYLCPDSKDPKRPKFNAQKVVDLYLERGNEIFSIPILHKIESVAGLLDEKYPADELEKALNDYFGETKLSQLLKPCLITSYDIKRRNAHFFAQHDAVKDISYDYYAKDIARATSAAPTYFECSQVKSLTNVTYPLIDGGVFANNPALCAYAEAYNRFDKTAKEMVILSLGTGYVRKAYDYNDVKNWGEAKWIRPLLDIMMSGVSDVVDYQLKQMYSAVKSPNQYLRINTEMPIDVSPDMDNATQQNLLGLKALGTETAQKNSKVIDDFLNFLI